MLGSSIKINIVSSFSNGKQKQVEHINEETNELVKTFGYNSSDDSVAFECFYNNNFDFNGSYNQIVSCSFFELRLHSGAESMFSFYKNGKKQKEQTYVNGKIAN